MTDTKCPFVHLPSPPGVSVRCPYCDYVSPPAEGVTITLDGIDWKARALAAEQALSDLKEAQGWLYISDDGPEWSADHPIECGQVPDARKVRPATAAALLEQLKDAWEGYHEGLASEARAHRSRDEARTELSTLKREVLEKVGPFVRMADSIKTDVASAHSNRGGGASQWMREDDSEFRHDLREAFRALSSLHEKLGLEMRNQPFSTR